MPSYLQDTIVSLQPVIRKNMALQTEALRQLSTGLKSPMFNPVATAMGNTLGAQAAVLLQASTTNAAQGVSMANAALSGLQSLIDLNTQMQTLCLQASSSTADHLALQRSLEGLVDSSQTIIASTRFADKPLFMGGEITQKAFPQTPSTLSIVGGNTSASGFADGLISPTKCIGKIEGKATSVRVTENATHSGNADVAVSIGSQLYKGEDLSLSAHTLWNLESKGGSVLTLQVGSSNLLDLQTVRTDLEAALGLNTGGAPAIFIPGSAGPTSEIAVNFSAVAEPGTYGFGIATIGGGRLTLSMSNGTLGDTIDLTGVNSGDTVFFPSLPGVSLTFNATPAATNNTLVGVTNDLNLKFQTGTEPSNQTTLSIPKTTLASLQYVDMDVSTPEAAARTLVKAQQGAHVLNSNSSFVGCGENNLKIAGSFAETLGKTIQDAQASYIEANPLTALEELKHATNALNKSVAGIAVALATQQKMANMLQNMLINMA